MRDAPLDLSGLPTLKAELGLSLQDIARALGVSKTQAYRMLHAGSFPCHGEARLRVLKTLLGWGEKVLQTRSKSFRAAVSLSDITPVVKTPRTRRNASGASDESDPEKEIDSMLIPKQKLTQEAVAYWGIRPDAFEPPYEPARVFLGASLAVAYEHMLATARYGGLMAIIGESGAGKTTLKDLLITELSAKGDVVVITPHTAAMERDDVKGKTLKVSHINEAIMEALAPARALRRSMQGQLSQIATVLAESSRERPERRHLLVFEEAHCLPKPSLRHLKRFLELRDPARRGLSRPLLSILLLGQPELADTLSPSDPDAREIWQRCQVVRLAPLDRDLPAYVVHHLGGQAGIFTPDALAALAGFLRNKQGKSALYPLAVNNWLIQCLNVNAGLGEKREINEVKVAVAKKRMDARLLAERVGGQS
jgi:type II secretory pathway predicted ATPase ExeA